MFCIFIGMDSLPADCEYVFDNEKFFATNKIIYDDFAKAVIKNVEHGSFLDETRFLDNFGVSLYVDAFSTGTKTLLNINSYTDKVFNCDEIGDNALREALKMQQGKICFSETRYKLAELVDWNRVDCILVNGRECRSYEELDMEV